MSQGLVKTLQLKTLLHEAEQMQGRLDDVEIERKLVLQQCKTMERQREQSYVQSAPEAAQEFVSKNLRNLSSRVSQLDVEAQGLTDAIRQVRENIEAGG